jgi:hypothetical protein
LIRCCDEGRNKYRRYCARQTGVYQNPRHRFHPNQRDTLHDPRCLVQRSRSWCLGYISCPPILNSWTSLTRLGPSVNNVGKSHTMPVYFTETPKDEINDIPKMNINGTIDITYAVPPDPVGGMDQLPIIYTSGKIQVPGDLELQVSTLHALMPFTQCNYLFSVDSLSEFRYKCLDPGTPGDRVVSGSCSSSR